MIVVREAVIWSDESENCLTDSCLVRSFLSKRTVAQLEMRNKT